MLCSFAAQHLLSLKLWGGAFAQGRTASPGQGYYPLFININLTALCQGGGCAQAQQDHDNQAQHKPGGTDGSGQVIRWIWCRHKLGIDREDQDNKWHQGQHYMPQNVKFIPAFAQVKERDSQAGCHIYHQDEDSNNSAQQAEGCSSTIDETWPQGKDNTYDHRKDDRNIRCAEACTDMRQGAWQCIGTPHGIEHARSRVDTRVGVGHCAVENGQNGNEREGTPDATGHGAPGIGIAWICQNFAKRPTNDACIGTENVEDTNGDGRQENSTRHSTTRVKSFFRQGRGRLKARKGQESKNHTMQDTLPAAQARLQAGSRIKGRGS